MFMALVREERYTNELLELDGEYTISIPFSTEMKDALSICGTKSGRDIDKEKEANIQFTKSKKLETPIVDKCNHYYECKIVFKQPMELENLKAELDETFYKKASGGKHILYFGEIIESYTI